jgi:hypothetical protein
MASGVYSEFLVQACQGNILWKASGGSTLKAQLTNSSYVFTNTLAETHDFRDDVTGDKTAGTTDQTLTLVDPATDTTNNQVELDASNDLTYTAVASGTVAGIVIYKNVGSASTDNLVAYFDFSGGNITANGGDIVVSFHADGCIAYAY